MPGQRFRISALTALAVMSAGVAAHAADYSQPYYQPPPQPIIIQQPQEEFGQNWYLRGHVGVGMNADYDLEYLINPANSNNFQFEHNSISDTYFIGAGVGYEWNNWLRFDFTAEYRAKTAIKAYGSYTYGGGTFGDYYEGNLKSWVFLANAFVDLGTWECFTPFVGAGIGGAYVTMADLTDTSIGTSGRGTGRNSSEWNLAWALYAGVGYNITNNFKIDLAYRYLSYGEVTDTIDCEGGCNADSYKFSNLRSHDIMLGLRWTCCEVDKPQPRYVYRPPPPPPPPPPISSRG